MDFLKEFKRRISLIEKPIKVIPLARQDEGRLFNIHKRSLPVGIDQIVMWGLPKDNGERIIASVLKTKVYQNEPHETKTFIYYDLVPQNATPKERSIFSNHTQIVK